MFTAVGVVVLACLASVSTAEVIQGFVFSNNVQESGVGIVQLWSLPSSNGELQPLSKRMVYGIDGNVPTATQVINFTAGEAREAFKFIIDPGNYSVVAYIDKTGTGSGAPNFSGDPQPLGWITSDPCFGGWDAICVRILQLKPNMWIDTLYLYLNASTPFGPVLTPRVSPLPGLGTLSQQNGISVLHVRGNATQRGFAHGYLAARQVLDMFEFFLLEDRVGSNSLYEDTVRPGLQSSLFDVSKHPGLLEEAQAIADGVCNAVPCVTVLQRPLDAWDVIAISAYGVFRATLPPSSTADPRKQHFLSQQRTACSQFVVWGNASSDGTTIAGRNMDGEIDVRKITVTHLTIFAVDSGEANAKRYVSVMWPGFIGTYSGLNEDGVMAMDNHGCESSGSLGKGNPIDTLVIRDFLLYGSASVSPSAAPSDVMLALTDGKASDQGGVFLGGNILVFAQPFVGQPHGAGFMYEGDHKGGEMRNYSNSRVLPSGQRIGATNHFYQYNSDPASYPTGSNPGATDNHPRPRGYGVCNGLATNVDFSSVWRFQSGLGFFEALGRAGVKVGVVEMQQALRNMVEAQTEHAIVTEPNAKRLHISVASASQPMWDAPYLDWKTFDFEDLFAQ